MQIKTFNYPSLESVLKLQSFETKSEISMDLGAYTFAVGRIGYSKIGIELGISLVNRGFRPFNIYTHSYFYRAKWFNDSDFKENVSKWYTDIIKEFDEFWKQHITENYIKEGE